MQLRKIVSAPLFLEQSVVAQRCSILLDLAVETHSLFLCHFALAVVGVTDVGALSVISNRMLEAVELLLGFRQQFPLEREK
jgi:hypothetical protein